MGTSIAPDAIGGEFDVLRKCNFKLLISKVEIPALDIISAPYPKLGVTELEIHYQNSKVKLAGKADVVQDFPLKVRDRLDKSSRKAISDWFKSVYDPSTGVIGKPSVYKKDGTLVMMNPQGEDVATWKLHGVWPKKVEYGDGDVSSADPVEITVDLSVDYCVLQ